MSLETNMSVILDYGCDCITDKKVDGRIVLLVFATFFLLFSQFVVISFVNVCERESLRQERRPARRMLRRRTLGYKPRTSPVVWNNYKPRYAYGEPMKLEAKQLPNDFLDMRGRGWTRYAYDNGQPMNVEAKQLPNDILDMRGRGWIRYITENEIKITLMGPEN